MGRGGLRDSCFGRKAGPDRIAQQYQTQLHFSRFISNHTIHSKIPSGEMEIELLKEIQCSPRPINQVSMLQQHNVVVFQDQWIKIHTAAPPPHPPSPTPHLPITSCRHTNPHQLSNRQLSPQVPQQPLTQRRCDCDICTHPTTLTLARPPYSNPIHAFSLTLVSPPPASFYTTPIISFCTVFSSLLA